MSVFFCYHNYKHGFIGEQWMIYSTIVAGHKTAEKLIGLKWEVTMLPVLTSLIPTNLLTYLKIGAIIFVIATSNYITWNFSQRAIDRERLSIAQSALLAEKNNTSYWLDQMEQSKKVGSKSPRTYMCC